MQLSHRQGARGRPGHSRLPGAMQNLKSRQCTRLMPMKSWLTFRLPALTRQSKRLHGKSDQLSRRNVGDVCFYVAVDHLVVFLAVEELYQHTTRRVVIVVEHHLSWSCLVVVLPSSVGIYQVANGNQRGCEFQRNRTEEMVWKLNRRLR